MEEMLHKSGNGYNLNYISLDLDVFDNNMDINKF